MEILLKLSGTTPLVMHNPRLVDPLDTYTRQIAGITAKRKRTEADNAEIAKLEWFGGLYWASDIGVHVPAYNLLRCLERAGTITRKGTAVVRALAAIDTRLPLVYPGPKDPEALYKKPEFQWRTSVVVGRARVMRVRPQFHEWALTAGAHLQEEVMSLDDFKAIAELAGRAEGLGEARRLGYGRFTIDVEEIAA